jgi:hypothetical protein
MALYCDSGDVAQITPWVPVPPLRKGELRPRIYEHERDLCALCGKVSWQHWTVPPLSARAKEALRRILVDP